MRKPIYKFQYLYIMLMHYFQYNNVCAMNDAGCLEMNTVSSSLIIDLFHVTSYASF